MHLFTTKTALDFIFLGAMMTMVVKNILSKFDSINYKLDFFLIGLIVALIGANVFHPFYFGDELVPWLMINAHSGHFIGAFLEYSQYKPRLIFNTIWVGIAFLDVPRMIPAFIMLGCEAFVCCMIYHIVRSITSLNQSRFTAWLAVFAFISSRFGVMLWHDYLSGIIETLSFSFFIVGVYLVAKAESDWSKYRFYIGMFFLFCSVFIHERYVFPVLSVGLCLLAFSKTMRENKIKVIFLTLLPGLIFVAVNHSIGAMSIVTGTAGQEVGIGTETLIAFLAYIGNVLLQINYGHDWFFGNINLGTAYGLKISLLTALIFFAIYIYDFFARNEIKKPSLLLTLFAVSALALIVVASLPGLARHEARWMYPVIGFVIVIGTGYLSNNIRQLFLICIILVNGFYFFSGSLNSVYNIVASRFAASLGSSLSVIAPQGAKGVILGESSSPWVIGGNSIARINSDSGAIFSRANALGAFQIDPRYIDVTKVEPSYGFVLVKVGEDKRHVPAFKQMSVDAANFLLNPDSGIQKSDKNENIIGATNAWQGWKFKQGDPITKELILRSGFDGFLELPAKIIDGQVLIYDAKSLNEDNVPMRLQVNWHDESGKFISTSIKVVLVGLRGDRYATLITAPVNAKTGLVYVTLHDGAHGEVKLESVSIKKISF